MVLEPDTVEVFEDPSDVIEETKFTTSMPTVAQSQVLSDSQSMSEAQLWYTLELKRLEMEDSKAEREERKEKRQAEERRIQAEMQDRK